VPSYDAAVIHEYPDPESFALSEELEAQGVRLERTLGYLPPDDHVPVLAHVKRSFEQSQFVLFIVAGRASRTEEERRPDDFDPRRNDREPRRALIAAQLDLANRMNKPVVVALVGYGGVSGIAEYPGLREVDVADLRVGGLKGKERAGLDFRGLVSLLKSWRPTLALAPARAVASPLVGLLGLGAVGVLIWLALRRIRLDIDPEIALSALRHVARPAVGGGIALCVIAGALTVFRHGVELLAARRLLKQLQLLVDRVE
jgi:hypothetical protein